MANFPWATTAPPGPASDGGYTRSQSALYARIKLSGQQVGIAQSVRWEGQTGNSPIKGIGESYSENKPGDMFWTWSVSRFSLRMMRLLDIVAAQYPVLAGQAYGGRGIGDIIDFRQIPFELEIDYQQNGYFPGSVVKSGPVPPYQYEDSNEKLEGCWIQNWSGEFSDPNSLRLENLSGWAMGFTYTLNGGVLATMGGTPAPLSFPVWGPSTPSSGVAA